MSSSTLAELSAASQALTTDEKLTLAGQLVARVVEENPSAYSAAWDAEVSLRRGEVISGKVKLIPADEVHRSIERLTE
jgi:Putative addiction module component